MRKRVLTSLALLAVLLVVCVYLDTLLLNAVIWIISMLGLVELLKATGILKHRDLPVVAMVQAFVIPFVRAGYIRAYALPILFLVILSYFVLLVKNYGSMGIGSCATAFLFSSIIPIFFSCAVYIRDQHGTARGGFYLLIALGAAWLSDTGAYFAGTFLGKRKLAPRVSPKKTVEGTVGGLVVSTTLILLFAALYEYLLVENGMPARVDFGMLALLSPIFSGIGMLGDLSASAIKRECGIKDFGNLMPGHGGILDRFDSVLFTLPAVYVTVGHVELLTFL